MYSALKSVQILIALLKENGISHVVLSPGGSSIPLIQSFEGDRFFTCYSVVDERSAAFFAMGVAQSVHTPVAMVCTSGTAAYNYWSGIAEAYYQQVPLVVITADRDPYLLHQMETQKLNQIGIYGDVCRADVSLPAVRDDNDFWYCQRLVNQALLELDHHGKGPVHINVPTMVGLPMGCAEPRLPEVRRITRVLPADALPVWEEKRRELSQAAKILVVCGEERPYSREALEAMRKFFASYPCVFAVEHLSNVDMEEALYSYPVTESLSLKDFEPLLPELVISIGNNVSSVNIKNHIRSRRKEIRHWLVQEKGAVVDVFKCLDTVFECDPLWFFERMTENARGRNDLRYQESWVRAGEKIAVPDLPYSNFMAAREFVGGVPENALVHLGILNSTRQTQFFRFRRGVEVFSNIGALGIDGSLSTFMGQAAATDRLCYLLIGDLSFFYDMNAAWIRHVPDRVRIVMVNNGGGGEFHLGNPKADFPRIDDHIAAGHHAGAGGWIESLGYAYSQARNESELKAGMAALAGPSDRPMFLEVFTDSEEDGKTMRAFYQKYNRDMARSQYRSAVKLAAKSILGEEGAGRAFHALRSGKDR